MGVPLAVHHVPYQSLAAGQVLVNRRPFWRNFDTAFLDELFQSIQLRRTALALDKIGDENLVLQEKAKVGVLLRQLNCLRDDSAAPAEAFFLRPTPVEIEMRK